MLNLDQCQLGLPALVSRAVITTTAPAPCRPPYHQQQDILLSSLLGGTASSRCWSSRSDSNLHADNVLHQNRLQIRPRGLSCTCSFRLKQSARPSALAGCWAPLASVVGFIFRSLARPSVALGVVCVKLFAAKSWGSPEGKSCSRRLHAFHALHQRLPHTALSLPNYHQHTYPYPAKFNALLGVPSAQCTQSPIK